MYCTLTSNFSFQKDKVFINADQKEILEQVAEKIKLQLIDAIPTQPINSSYLTKKSSKTDEVLPDLQTTQEPVAVAEEPVKRKASEMHIGHLKSEDEETEEADKALKEDKELIQLVESIISDEKGQACENEPNGAKHLSEELALISKNLRKGADEAVSATEILSHVEEPVAGAEEPLLFAEEIADIVEEILQITQEQESLYAEESKELQRNKFKDAKEPLTTSVELALIAEEVIDPAAFEFTLAANRSVAINEESWEIIGEPVNIFGCLEEPVLIKSKCDSADSSQLLSQLRSACTKVLEDASYKAFSVDVCAEESTVHITIELCLDELTCLNKVSYNIDDRSTRKAQDELTACDSIKIRVY